jgi:hypothetical protein
MPPLEPPPPWQRPVQQPQWQLLQLPPSPCIPSKTYQAKA